MGIVSIALKKDTARYIDYRFSHLSENHREIRKNKTIDLLSDKPNQIIRKFHLDIMKFFNTNRHGLKRLKEVDVSNIQKRNIDVKKFMGKKPNKTEMARLIQVHGGNMNEIVRDCLDVSDD